MADISTELAAIMAAVFGRDVRQSIHDAIFKINATTEVCIDAGTAVNSTGSSSTGYYPGSFYINISTWKLWKCTGTNTWEDLGTFRGLDGRGIASISGPVSSGLTDTYTINYTDGTTRTFNVENGNGIYSITGPVSSGLTDTYTIHLSNGTTVDFEVENGNGITSITGPVSSGLTDTYTIHLSNGTTFSFNVENGEDGAKWYRGTAIEGKVVNPTVFINSGITEAHVDDMYLNTLEGAIYHCTIGGNASTAAWIYDFTIASSASGATVIPDLEDVDINNLQNEQVLQYDSSSNKWKNEIITDTIVQNSNKAARSGSVYSSLNTLNNKFNDYYTKMEMDEIDGVINEIQRMFGVHNLTPFDPRYAETNNITVEKLANGTVRYNTPENPVSADTVMGISNNSNSATTTYQHTLKTGEYKLIVHANSALTANKSVRIYNADDGTVLAEANSGTDATVAFTLSADTNVLVAACFASGQTLSNFEVQAFVILGSDTDTTYLPFAYGNDKLTQNLYLEKITDFNTVWKDGNQVKWYYAGGNSANAPVSGSVGWLIVEFSINSGSHTQIAFAQTSNRFEAWYRRSSGGTWTDWYNMWDYHTHPMLYAHTFTKTNDSTTTAITYQQFMYEFGLDLKAFNAALPSGYYLEIEAIAINGHMCVPAAAEKITHGSGDFSIPCTYHSIGSTGVTINSYYITSSGLASNHYNRVGLSASTKAFTNDCAVRDSETYIEKKTAGQDPPSKTATIYYRIMQQSSATPTI